MGYEPSRPVLGAGDYSSMVRLSVIVWRFSMTMEGFSLGVEASLVVRSRIWGFPSSCSLAGGGGLRFAVSVGNEPSRPVLLDADDYTAVDGGLVYWCAAAL